MRFVPPERHLLQARDLVDARYAEPLGVDDMARAAGLSRAHFSREFRRTFGESPHAYLLTRRLERAAALLRATDRSVVAICFAVGLRERRLVHDELHPRLRDHPDCVPRIVPAGVTVCVDPGMRAACARPSATPHVSRRRRSGAALASAPVDSSRKGNHDQDCFRRSVGARPGRGARLLHRKARLGAPCRRHPARAGELSLADRRPARISPMSPCC